MRTTIELRDETRARLLRLAAERGEKGFSALVEEALDLYLDEIERRQAGVDAAVSVLGTLSDAAADRLESSVSDLRSTWR